MPNVQRHDFRSGAKQQTYEKIVAFRHQKIIFRHAMKLNTRERVSTGPEDAGKKHAVSATRYEQCHVEIDEVLSWITNQSGGRSALRAGS